MFWTEPLDRANLLFGYVQCSPERTSFSGSAVPSGCQPSQIEPGRQKAHLHEVNAHKGPREHGKGTKYFNAAQWQRGAKTRCLAPDTEDSIHDNKNTEAAAEYSCKKQWGRATTNDS